jgi:hypothetical protein
MNPSIAGDQAQNPGLVLDSSVYWRGVLQKTTKTHRFETSQGCPDIVVIICTELRQDVQDWDLQFAVTTSHQ